MNEKVKNLEGKLIVSCQALSHEPLHSSFIMGRMALAAKQGGAYGIRANTKEDIKYIANNIFEQKNTDKISLENIELTMHTNVLKEITQQKI